MSEPRTILFVDDVEMFRELGALFLARSGRVLTAGSGEEALEMARRERPDLIVVDLLMPGLDGDAVCRRVKRDPELNQTPVIILVGADAASEWGRAVRAGADDVLAKPIAQVSFVASVSRFLRGPAPQGLPRIPLSVDVEIKLGERTRPGRLVNLSRGGLFLETECELGDESEIALQFELPESGVQFNPTARVVWRREAGERWGCDGIGLRFVDISSDLVRKLEDYVFDRAPEPVATGAGATA